MKALFGGRVGRVEDKTKQREELVDYATGSEGHRVDKKVNQCFIIGVLTSKLACHFIVVVVLPLLWC